MNEFEKSINKQVQKWTALAVEMLKCLKCWNAEILAVLKCKSKYKELLFTKTNLGKKHNYSHTYLHIYNITESRYNDALTQTRTMHVPWEHLPSLKRTKVHLYNLLSHLNSNGKNRVIGRTYVFLPILTRVTQTCLLGQRPSGHVPRGSLGSSQITTSPTSMYFFSSVHFFRALSAGKNSRYAKIF